jgi:methylglyoxal synthase
MDLSALAERLRQAPGEDRQVPADEWLITAGDPPGRLLLIEHGTVVVLTRMAESIRLEAPTVIGEVSLLGQRPTMADVIAQTDIRLRQFDAATLAAWGHDHPLDYARILQDLAQLAVQRLSGHYHARYVALVAHDGRKQDLVAFVQQHQAFFEQHPLLTTATTGKQIEEQLNITIARRVCSGPQGGDLEIGGLVSRGCVDAVFFYRDPLWAQPHQADVNALVRVCEFANVPLATNDTTARLIVQGLIRGD